MPSDKLLGTVKQLTAFTASATVGGLPLDLPRERFRGVLVPVFTPKQEKDRPDEILWIGQLDCHDVASAGGKAASLSRLAASFRVPPGFCLTTSVYSRWGEEARLGRSPTPPQPIPPPLFHRLTDAYVDLARRCGALDPSVAVRSSAVDEDGSLASFAGLYETYLNVVGVGAVADAVVRCWTSAGSERALAYRHRWGQAPEGIRLAVLIQQFIPAEVSAVVFSANPVTGNRDEVVINASWGLGETVVGGRVNPDTYVVRKGTLTVVQRQIAENG